MYVAHIQIQQVGTGQFSQNGHDAARTVHVFHVEFGGGGSHFTQARDPARNLVDIGHREFHTGFLGSSQQVQHGVGGTTHGHVQSHGVFKSLVGGDVAWQDRFVV